VETKEKKKLHKFNHQWKIVPTLRKNSESKYSMTEEFWWSHSHSDHDFSFVKRPEIPWKQNQNTEEKLWSNHSLVHGKLPILSD
jgi:hypothetical protein